MIYIIEKKNHEFNLENADLGFSFFERVKLNDTRCNQLMDVINVWEFINTYVINLKALLVHIFNLESPAVFEIMVYIIFFNLANLVWKILIYI